MFVSVANLLCVRRRHFGEGDRVGSMVTAQRNREVHRMCYMFFRAFRKKSPSTGADLHEYTSCLMIPF
jgi:hypothetical protein